MFSLSPNQGGHGKQSTGEQKNLLLRALDIHQNATRHIMTTILNSLFRLQTTPFYKQLSERFRPDENHKCTANCFYLGFISLWANSCLTLGVKKKSQRQTMSNDAAIAPQTHCVQLDPARRMALILTFNRKPSTLHVARLVRWGLGFSIILARALTRTRANLGPTLRGQWREAEEVPELLARLLVVQHHLWPGAKWPQWSPNRLPGHWHDTDGGARSPFGCFFPYFQLTMVKHQIRSQKNIPCLE